jgi:hypothetical protein
MAFDDQKEMHLYMTSLKAQAIDQAIIHCQMSTKVEDNYIKFYWNDEILTNIVFPR